jgi:major membrane immunogen (membrane-anchored lipoprotein)
MRALMIPVIAATLLLGACSSQKMSRSGAGNYDDIYYSSSDAA